jgi:hypothetical protein
MKEREPHTHSAMDESQTGVNDSIDETLPDVVKDFLKQGGELESIVLRDTGEWRHEGMEFPNERIVDLFDRSVGRTEGGTWVLEIGRFTYPIEVEDTGFFVEHIDLDAIPATLRLSDETTEELDVETVTYLPEGRLYCRVKDGEFRARFKRPAYYDAAEQFVEEDDGQIWFEHGSERVLLGSLDDES